MIIRDFNKSFLQEIKFKKESVVIIDFIDERFDLLKVDDSYVTRSNEFVNGKLDETYAFERISRFQEETHVLWEKSCLVFLEQLLSIISVENIIIHEAYWTEKYIDKNNNLINFPDLKIIRTNNEVLQRYYGFVKSRFPHIACVSAERIGSANHKWGLSPVHYTEKYYMDIYSQGC